MEFTKLAQQWEEIKQWMDENPSHDLGAEMHLISNFLVLKELESSQLPLVWKTYTIHHWNHNRRPSPELIAAWTQADHIICCHPEALPRYIRYKHIFPDHKGLVQYKQGRFSPVY